MSSAAAGAGFTVGRQLATDDYRALDQRWISSDWADAARLRRVDADEGRATVGYKTGDMAGIAIPYYLPDGNGPVSFRIRRDHPDLRPSSNGDFKEDKKYAAEIGRPNHVYFPPRTVQADFENASLPLLIVEGEFKAIAARRLASYQAQQPRFVVFGLSGVRNWQGTVGKTSDHNGTRRDVKGVLPDFDRIAWKERSVIIAFDADLAQKEQVRKARYQLSKELRSRGAFVGFLQWDETRGKGIDDWLANEGPEPVLDAIGNIDFNRTTGWKAKLMCTLTGKPKPLVENVRLALETAPEFDGVLAYDEFANRVVMQEPAPWTDKGNHPWGQEDDLELEVLLQRNGLEVGLETVGQAVQLAASHRRFHPVREYLEACKRDDTSRINSWLSTYLKAADTSYIRTIGRCWLISAVARVYQPGCKADYLIILEGPQGIGKSKSLRALAGPYFTDHVPDFAEKDAAIQLAGAWIVELSELDAVSRAELSLVKSFITGRPIDIGRLMDAVPRTFAVNASLLEP
jgi:hypothetical protein